MLVEAIYELYWCFVIVIVVGRDGVEVALVGGKRKQFYVTGH